MINVMIIDAKPPKKHLATKLKGSLFLSFLKMVYKKMITGVMDAMSRVMELKLMAMDFKPLMLLYRVNKLSHKYTNLIGVTDMGCNRDAKLHKTLQSWL